MHNLFNLNNMKIILPYDQLLFVSSVLAICFIIVFYFMLRYMFAALSIRDTSKQLAIAFMAMFVEYLSGITPMGLCEIHKGISITAKSNLLPGDIYLIKIDTIKYPGHQVVLTCESFINGINDNIRVKTIVFDENIIYGQDTTSNWHEHLYASAIIHKEFESVL